MGRPKAKVKEPIQKTDKGKGEFRMVSSNSIGEEFAPSESNPKKRMKEEETEFVSISISQTEYELFKATDIEPMAFILEVAKQTILQNKEYLEKYLNKKIEEYADFEGAVENYQQQIKNLHALSRGEMN